MRFLHDLVGISMWVWKYSVEIWGKKFWGKFSPKNSGEKIFFLSEKNIPLKNLGENSGEKIFFYLKKIFR